MNHHSIKIRTLIILLSIVMIGCEFSAYYFLNSLKVPMAMAVILNIVLLHIYLEASLSYLTCFLHSALITLLSTACTILIYYNQTENLLIYSKNLPLLILLNWLVPVLYCIFRDFTDRGPRFVNFRSFFVRTSIFFGSYYLLILVKFFITAPLTFPNAFSEPSNPFIPFLATAAYIEDIIYSGAPLLPLLKFIIKLILLLLPAGFYSSILLRESPKFFSVLFTFLFPLLTECIPMFYGGTFSMDTYLWKLIGLMLGIVLYKILNTLSNHFLKCNFLTPRNNYTFFNLYY